MHRVIRFVADRWVMAVGLLVLAYMATPVLVIMLLSFNEPSSKRTTYQLDGGINWSLSNWTGMLDDPDIKGALVNSLLIGAISTAIATILGTMIAFALVRHRFLGRSSVNLLIFLPMATPEIVMGSSLLALFVALQVPTGFGTIVIAHVMFCISFVVVTVKARLAGLDPRLQEAATDLYATPFATFRQVTLPLVAPGIASAALLSFSLSFDDYIITAFSSGSGSVVTFPLFVWGANQRGIPPEVNAIATGMFLVAFVIVLVGQLNNLRRAKRAAAS
ncbi:spermidine/putrescine transport system permease protein [Allocatelliglobosispora scoriae]|uniref:Spermidine/putrescine transport system permease protein n=1 Tax=Allocatelliglobosispora scoriae TaxID=643052 RepID=A0A841BU40_9ACTN|nr:ABC transporter permease [Allocatelliglobosispora scoriae]MBB5870262.1 spermidine/putrescine transport system permease protein [Allocatelliglobosispora scoriae]